MGRLFQVVAIAVAGMARIATSGAVTRGAGGETVGVLSLESRQPAAFPPPVASLCESVSQGISAALEGTDITERLLRAKVALEMTFDAMRSSMGCFHEGTIYWDGPDAQGLAAAELDEGPFTYRVEVVLDGSRHVAEAEWPADEIPGNEPSVPLRFTPSLPSLE